MLIAGYLHIDVGRGECVRRLLPPSVEESQGTSYYIRVSYEQAREESYAAVCTMTPVAGVTLK